MNLPYVLRKYFGGNLHLRKKWKARIRKGLKWLKIWKGYRCQMLFKNKKKTKKKKITPLLSIAVILSRKSYGVNPVEISFIVLSTKYFPSLLWFSISNSFLALTLWPVITTWLKTFWSLILVFDYISGEDFWKLDLWG